MIGALARKFFGSANDRRVKGYQSRVNAINALEPELAALSDEALKARTAEFRQQLADGKTLDPAGVTWILNPYDEFAVDAFKNTLNGLAGLDGRKVMIYVSEGLPATAGIELFDAVQQKYRENASTLEQFEFDMNTRYASIVQAANANGVTLWPLDATGLAVDDLISAENRTIESRPNSFLMRQNTQAPLQMMAEQTGGVAAVNTNDWKNNLDELAKDFSDFYSIGYRSTTVRAPR